MKMFPSISFITKVLFSCASEKLQSLSAVFPKNYFNGLEKIKVNKICYLFWLNSFYLHNSIDFCIPAYAA